MEQRTNQTQAEANVLLRMENINKTFPGVKALDNVSLTVKAGTVHALMGENGAGKSTLMKCLFGVYTKDSGHVYLDGREVNFANSKEALENGIAMVHQELNQALKRNVMDNMWLGRFPKVAPGIPLTSEKKMYTATKELFAKLGLDVDPKTVMSKMSVSQRQMVEIAKAVSYNAKVIVFDEPTSSLTEQEVEHLFRIINMLRAEGCGIIYISHKMEEILRYIAGHLDGDLSVDALAGRFFISRYYLMHRFKEVTGSTVHQYTVQKRLLRAGELIREGVPVMKAAEQAGFPEYSSFLRAFQSTFHTSPRSFK